MIDLIKILDAINPSRVIGNTTRTIRELIQLNVDNENENALMWASSKYYNTLKEVKKGIIICSRIEDNDIKPDVTYLLVDNPRNAFRISLETFFVTRSPKGIATSAKIASDVQLGKDLYIGENVVIEEGCVVGDFSEIDHNTVIKKNTIIGKSVKIGSNNVIGGVGFGYEKDENGKYVVIPHIGNVKIEDGVEIGNCTTIDRAVMGSTHLMKNSKIDNLVHIAHGVIVGENSLVIANAMVAGSVVIGKNVWVAPSSSILNKIEIEDDALIGMGAVVIKKVNKKEIIIGNPGKVLKRK